MDCVLRQESKTRRHPTGRFWSLGKRSQRNRGVSQADIPRGGRTMGTEQKGFEHSTMRKVSESKSPRFIFHFPTVNLEQIIRLFRVSVSLSRMEPGVSTCPGE